jgi:hypothetical protein
MSKTLSELLAEADHIIEKRGEAAKPVESGNDDIIKLASMLSMDDEQTTVVTAPLEMTLFEKVAHSMAIVETVARIGEFEKLAQFKEAAAEQGWSEAQIDEYLEKKATPSPSRFGKMLPASILALGGMGAAGAVGHKKGKKKGYGEAQSDMQQAIEEYASTLEG